MTFYGEVFFLFYFSEIASKYIFFNVDLKKWQRKKKKLDNLGGTIHSLPFGPCVRYQERCRGGVVNGNYLSLCDSKRQCWGHLVNVKESGVSPVMIFSEVEGQSSACEDLLCGECVLLTTNDKMFPALSHQLHTSSFVFCQLPALVRGRLGSESVVCRVCGCMCEWGGWRPTGHRPILLAFLMHSRSLRSFRYSPTHTQIYQIHSE